MSRDVLGLFEHAVLSLLMKQHCDAYGALIHEKVQLRLGRDISIGAVHTTLERLEKKGFITSRWGEPTAKRGGRRKKYYKIEAPGVAAVQHTEAAWAAATSATGALAHV